MPDLLHLKTHYDSPIHKPGLTEGQLVKVRKTIYSILNGIKYELENLVKQNAEQSISNQSENTPLDYFLFLTEDYFYTHISNSVAQNKLPGDLKFSLIRLYITKDNICF